MGAAKKPVGVRAVTLHDHIKELRNRLFFVAIIFLATSALAYNYKETLIYYLLKPLGNEKLIYLNPAGGFSFIFQVTMYVGLAASIPFLVYNLYKFIAPALPERARKHSAGVMISSLVLLCIGVTFGYFFAIPGALNFLNNFAEGYILPSLTADSYLNFILAYTAGLGILFQLPLVLLLIHWIHPLKPGGLLKFERYMILIAFIGAAIITPTPDVMNQLVIALPIILMYQAGLIAICLSIARAKRRARPPKLSPAERRTIRRTEKQERKSAAKQPVSPPTHRPSVPSMPQLTVDAVNRIPAAKPQKQKVPVMDIVGPLRKKPVVSTNQQPMKVQATPQQSTAAAQSSPVRKTMDVMMSPQAVRGTINRPQRPLQPRIPTIQVPARSSKMGSAVLVDGITLLY